MFAELRWLAAEKERKSNSQQDDDGMLTDLNPSSIIFILLLGAV